MILCLWTGCSVNPISGEKQFMLFPENQDVAIGLKYAPQIEKEMGGKIPNEALQSYINQVGQKIVRVSHKRGFDYQFTALNNKTVNAFALPGGYIFITKGMLEKLQTEAQLAGILAHETVHVVARHSSAAMSTQIGTELLLSAVITEDTPSSVSTAANLTRQIVTLKYSRKDERQADMAGMDYMVKAGYDPYGMVETMQMLQREQKTRSIEFFSTHPEPANRVTYLREKIQTKYPAPGGLKVGREDYQSRVLGQLNN